MSELSLDALKKLDYPVRIEFDPEQNIFTAEFPDLPGCSADGPTVAEAYELAVHAKNDWLQVTLEQGLQVPQPSKNVDYSGRILLRIPTSLHATLADKASLYQSSLNQYIVHLLSGANIGEMVERRIDELAARVVGCDRRINYLTGHVQVLSSQLSATFGRNITDLVSDDFPRSYPIGGGINAYQENQDARLLQ
jgi:antitoxin HicB